MYVRVAYDCKDEWQCLHKETLRCLTSLGNPDSRMPSGTVRVDRQAQVSLLLPVKTYSSG